MWKEWAAFLLFLIQILYFSSDTNCKNQKHCHNQEVRPLTGMLQEICVRVQSFD